MVLRASNPFVEAGTKGLLGACLKKGEQLAAAWKVSAPRTMLDLESLEMAERLPGQAGAAQNAIAAAASAGPESPPNAEL